MPETTSPPEMLFMPKIYPKVVFPADPYHATPRLWTKGELVEWTQSSPDFIRSEIRSGRLKAEYLSNARPRFHWSDIVDWLQSRTRAISVRQGLALHE